MQCLGHTHTKKIFCCYLNIKFHWMFCSFFLANLATACSAVTVSAEGAGSREWRVDSCVASKLCLLLGSGFRMGPCCLERGRDEQEASYLSSLYNIQPRDGKQWREIEKTGRLRDLLTVTRLPYSCWKARAKKQAASLFWEIKKDRKNKPTTVTKTSPQIHLTRSIFI